MCVCVCALGFVEGESVLRLDENENDDGRSRPASAALTLFLLYSPFLFVNASAGGERVCECEYVCALSCCVVIYYACRFSVSLSLVAARS